MTTTTLRTGLLASGVLVTVLAAALLGGLALYGTGSGLGNGAGARPCAASAATAARLGPLARGEVAAFDVLKSPRPAPAIRFTGPEGAEPDLAGFTGKALLVNLWARWCGPCKAEMPALDRLQAELGGPGFEVVAINIETRQVEQVPAWLDENRIDHLARYTDPTGRVLPAVQAQTGSPGLPTTLLIDARGCTVGVMKGPADWASEDGKRLIRALTGGVS